MTIDRSRFQRELESRSPLSIEQFEALIGEVTDENKSLAWQLMNEPKPIQWSIHAALTKCRAFFPEAKLTGVRNLT
jgi:hypothetical protein